MCNHMQLTYLFFRHYFSFLGEHLLLLFCNWDPFWLPFLRLYHEGMSSYYFVIYFRFFLDISPNSFNRDWQQGIRAGTRVHSYRDFCAYCVIFSCIDIFHRKVLPTPQWQCSKKFYIWMWGDTYGGSTYTIPFPILHVCNTLCCVRFSRSFLDSLGTSLSRFGSRCQSSNVAISSFNTFRSMVCV